MKRKTVIRIAAAFGMVGLTLWSAQASEAARSALRVCGVSVIPSLLPFFVLSKLFASGGFSLPRASRLFAFWFRVSGDCLPAFFVSLLGGYPAGAAAVADLYQSGAITKQDAEKALCFCNNSGPAFFLSFIGGAVLHSTLLGLTLYLIHILSAILCGRLLAGRKCAALQIRRIPSNREPQGKRLTEAVSESCASLLQICGLIVFFSVLLALAEEVGLFCLFTCLPRFPLIEAKAVICGFFELSVGILRAADSRYAFVLCAFLMGWGGLCVHTQAKALWQKAGLRPRRYLYGKLLHGLLSAIFALTCAAPNAFSLSVCGVLLLTCVFFPEISKNWGRNLAQNAL